MRTRAQFATAQPAASLGSAAPGSASRAGGQQQGPCSAYPRSPLRTPLWHRCLLPLSRVILPGAGGWRGEPRPPKQGGCGSPPGARRVPGASLAVSQPAAAGPGQGSVNLPCNAASQLTVELPSSLPPPTSNSLQTTPGQNCREKLEVQTRLVDLRSEGAEGSTGAFLCVRTESGRGEAGADAASALTVGRSEERQPREGLGKLPAEGSDLPRFPSPPPGLRGQPGAPPPSLRLEASRGGMRAGPPLLPAPPQDVAALGPAPPCREPAGGGRCGPESGRGRAAFLCVRRRPGSGRGGGPEAAGFFRIRG